MEVKVEQALVHPKWETKMDPKWKAIWVKALRGEVKDRFGNPFEQDHGYLKTDKGHCCLGVLVELQDPSFMDGHSLSSLRTSLLPEAFIAGLTYEQMGHLASMNDYGDSFSKIADYIEANL